MLTTAYAFVVANWSTILTVLAVLVYAIANVAPRPDPVRMTGWRLAAWGTLDRLCLLTAAAVPGVFKALFAPTTPKGGPIA